MSKNNENKDKSVLAIIGGLVLGLGAGLFFFPVSVFGVTSVFAFIGCTLGGLGLGLIITSVLSTSRKDL